MEIKYDAILVKLRESDGDGSKGGLLIGDIQTAINDGSLIITPNKQLLYASWLEPLQSGSAYFLNLPVPAQVFSHTADEGIKVLLNTSQIPPNTTKLKYRVNSYYVGSPAALNVIWSARAGYTGATITPVYGTGVKLTHAQNAAQNTRVTSLFSEEVTIGGEAITNDTLVVELKRLGSSDANDTLNVSAHLTWIEIEFVTVE